MKRGPLSGNDTRRAVRKPRAEGRSKVDSGSGGSKAEAGSKAERDPTVWVLRDGEPRRIPVVTGLSDGTFAEVTRGDLKPGDRVVVDEVARDDHGPATPSQTARPRFHL